MSPLKKPTTKSVTRKLPKAQASSPMLEQLSAAPTPEAHSESSFRLLDELRRELEKGNQLNELRSDITRLENEKRNLEQQVRHLETRLQAQHGQTTATLEALKNTVRGQVQSLDQQLQVFSLDTSHTVEGLLAILHGATIPNPDTTTIPVHHPGVVAEPVVPRMQPIAHTVPTPAPTQPVAAETFFEPLIPEPIHQSRKAPSRFRRIAIRTVFSLLMVAVLGGGYLFLRPTNKIFTDGEVAGASTQPTPEVTGSPDPYAASFAEIPFEKTVWELATDTDFGIAVQFPSNTSTKVKVIGGNNLWFVRKSTYLMRFTKTTTDETLDQWWSKNSSTYTDQAKASKINYKGKPAYYLDSLEKTPTSGSSYIIKHAGNILTIWVKDEPSTTDDGKRISKMSDSLTFTN
ncbi:hypothetical protein BH11PAT4_BH11PAT4_1310 [soil metagenome]